MPPKKKIISINKKQLKKYHKYIIVVYIVILIVIAFLFRKKEMVRTAFDIHIPEPYTVCGIDVSRYQETINWEKVAKARSGKDSLKVSFAFIKATEGKSLKDPSYEKNWINSKKNNILRGAYHYYKPNINSKIQADNFIATVKIEKGDLPPVLDIEETSRYGLDNMRKGLKNWLTIIEKHYGVKPIIYCYVDFYERHLSTNDFKDYPFWIAHYYEDKLRVNDRWHFWQHSDIGRIDGIRTNVDFSVFNGTYDELLELCKN